MNVITYCGETNTIRLINETGVFIEHTIIGNKRLNDLIKPVICNHCNKIYDLTTVKVKHRYEDCSQFITPCCKNQFADDRLWKSFPDFILLDKHLSFFNKK